MDVEQRKQIVIEIIARCLCKVRYQNDQKRSMVIARVSKQNPNLSDEEKWRIVVAELIDLDRTIIGKEKEVTGTTIDEIIKNLLSPKTAHMSLQGYTKAERKNKKNLKIKEAREILRTKEPYLESDVDQAEQVESESEPQRPSAANSFIKPQSSVSEPNAAPTDLQVAAKKESDVNARIAELRRKGLWSASMLPMCVEPPRNKTHWDYLLEEVKWMATDFRQERKLKKNIARKLCMAIMKTKKDKEFDFIRAEQRIIKDARKTALFVAKIIRDFWKTVDKVVDCRAHEILERRKRQALDKHLSFIVGEADKLSCIVQEGLSMVENIGEVSTDEDVLVEEDPSNPVEITRDVLTKLANEAAEFQPKGFTLQTTKIKTLAPSLLRGELREYQMVGVDWLVTLYEKDLNGILADEMGLGKTIQTIALLAHLATSESIWGPHLIIVPTSVLLNWEMEFKKWCPALKILTYFGSAKERAEKRQGWCKPNSFHVCITSYTIITSDIRLFKMKKWQYMILDEAHNIKNWKSRRWQALLNMRSRKRLLLTGTPLQNSLMELWSLMHFLMPTIFASREDFKDWFSNPLGGMVEGSVGYNASLVKQLHRVLRPFILRRLKSEVEKQMPSKIEKIIKCPLSKRQRYLYDDFMHRRDTKENLKSGNLMAFLNIVMQLRKCCNHPNLFEPRPVVSPLVVAPIRKTYPSILFDIIGERTPVKAIPDCLNLKLVGSQLKNICPTMKWIKDWSVVQSPPAIKGFYFSIPTKIYKKGGGQQSGLEISNKDTTMKALNQNGDIKIRFPAQTELFQTARFPAKNKGFNRRMAKSQLINVDYAYEFSPPLKQRKLVESSVISGSFIDKVPDDYINYLKNEEKRRLNIAQLGFRNQCSAIYLPDTIKLCRIPPNKLANLSFFHDNLQIAADFLLKRFSVYVEPVITEQIEVEAFSCGRRTFDKIKEEEMQRVSRISLQQFSSTIHEKLLARKLQFPEVRLIEYDCGKLQTLATLLRQLYAYNHRCLIFTQMSRMLDILQAFLSYHGYQYFRLDGSTSIEQRHVMMERFNSDPRIFCFILSTRSGGIGVNLTGADTVIFYDSDWNPVWDAQAQDRCHRIGQTRNVTIYRLISEKTVEENILKKAVQKRRLGEIAIDEASFTPDFFKQTENIRDLIDGENITFDDEPAQAIEKAMTSIEDEQDVIAAKQAQLEAGADYLEFEEANIEKKRKLTEGDDESQDDKYLELIHKLKPIERYAVKFLETEYKPIFEEECKANETLIEQKKENYIRAQELPADIDDSFYGYGSNIDEIYPVKDGRMVYPGERGYVPIMMWNLPIPVQNDVYFDECLDMLYEKRFMTEKRLPPKIYETKKNQVLIPSSTIPPTISKLYNDKTIKSNVVTKVDQMLDRSKKPLKGILKKSSKYELALLPNEIEEGPEWSLREDQAITIAVSTQDKEYNLNMSRKSTRNHTVFRPHRMESSYHYNWAHVAKTVNSVVPAPQRAPQQCAQRYENVIRPKFLENEKKKRLESAQSSEYIQKDIPQKPIILSHRPRPFCGPRTNLFNTRPR